MTVAVPVSVATLPIGSSEGVCAGAAAAGEGAAGRADAGVLEEGVGEAEGVAAGRAGAGAGKGVGKGAGWVCASRVGPRISSTADGANASSMVEGTA